MNAARQAFGFILDTMETDPDGALYGDAGAVADEDAPGDCVRAHFTGDRRDHFWDLYNRADFDHVDYEVIDISPDGMTVAIYGFLPGYGDSGRIFCCGNCGMMHGGAHEAADCTGF